MDESTQKPQAKNPFHAKVLKYLQTHTRYDLMRETGASEGQVVRWEKGEVEVPKLNIQTKLCEVLEANRDELGFIRPPKTELSDDIAGQRLEEQTQVPPPGQQEALELSEETLVQNTIHKPDTTQPPIGEPVPPLSDPVHLITQRPPIPIFTRRKILIGGGIIVGSGTALVASQLWGKVFGNPTHPHPTPTSTPTPTPFTPQPNIGAWQKVQSMARPRVLFSATRLNNGMVLVAGGLSSPTVPIDITEIFNYQDNSWRQTKGLLKQPRVITSSALVTLKTGQALLTTGTDADLQHDFATTELFDPQSDTWKVVAGLLTPRRSAPVALLKDGYHVLAIGGANGPPDPNQFQGSTELYDVMKNQWFYAGDLSVARQNEIAVTLDDGRVMVVGGEGPESTFGPAVDLYNPIKKSWSTGQPMNRGLTGGTMTILRDHRVLLVGGGPGSAGTTTAAIYDPQHNTWTPSHPMSIVRSQHTASLLPNGHVLVVGGAAIPDPSKTCEIYDPFQDSWYDGPPLKEARAGHVAVTLLDNNILIMGGTNFAQTYLDTCERLEITLR